MKTVINFILDASGSMRGVRQNTIEAFNEYINSFRNKDDVYLKLTIFNSMSIDVYALDKIKNFPELTEDLYNPTELTPLYDAIGHSFTALEKELGKKKRNVLFVIYTDGLENMSTDYNREKIFKMISDKKDWTFVFLGANQDSWESGVGLGMKGQNTMNYQANASGIADSMRELGTATLAYYVTEGATKDAFWETVDYDNSDLQTSSDSKE